MALTCWNQDYSTRQCQNTNPVRAEIRQDFAKCVVLFKDYIMQTKVNKIQELNISSTTTKTELNEEEETARKS